MQADRVELEDRPCPNGCVRDDRFVIEAGDHLHGIAGRFRVVRCACCKLLRTNPRPTPEAIGAYYPGDYAPYRSAEPAPGGGAPSPVKAWLRKLLRLEARALPPVAAGRMIEIGCANGTYLEQMRRAGWAVEGIEFSPDAADEARARGFAVQTTAVETARAPARRVDVVAAWMVLEHLHEPVRALRKVREWVEPDGYLIGSVPDASAFERVVFGERWFALQLPTHLYHYTPATLAQVLRNAGWELTRIAWQRDCNNLLRSLEYWAGDLHHPRVLRFVRWLRSAPAPRRARVALGGLLALLRQSGRIEFWARPLPALRAATVEHHRGSEFA